MDEGSLNPDEILAEEFEYAAETALQANEDRVKVYYQFLAAGATLIAAVFFVDRFQATHIAAIGFILLVITVIGFLSLLKLAKLRLAWRDSAKAMCEIKAYYQEVLDDPRFSEAFNWDHDSLPEAAKPSSVSYIMTVTIGIINSLTLGAAVGLFALFAGQVTMLPPMLEITVPVAVGTLVFAVFFVYQIRLWSALCNGEIKVDAVLPAP